MKYVDTPQDLTAFVASVRRESRVGFRRVKLVMHPDAWEHPHPREFPKSRNYPPITMEITEKRVKFSGPESSVEMEAMAGFGGKPVKIMNLPNPAYQDYTQYKSVAHKHASDNATWSHSGTNGFTSTMELGSKN